MNPDDNSATLRRGNCQASQRCNIIDNMNIWRQSVAGLLTIFSLSAIDVDL